jgi:hypothetical protein
MATSGDDGRRWPSMKFVFGIGFLLSLAFVILLLIIVNAPPGDDVEPNIKTSPNPQLFWTRRSQFVYETLLAGLLGAYIAELFRIHTIQSIRELSEYGQQFMAALFLGGSAAMGVGVLFPLVVLGRFEGTGINSWTLVAAGGLAGYRARSALSHLSNVITHMLSRFDTMEISRSIKEGMQEVLAQPLPVRYDGFLAVDVTRSNESVIIEGDPGDKIARLERGKEFAVQVQFAHDKIQLGAPGRGIVRPINVQDGDDSPASAPFRLLVDFGFAEVPPAERIVDAPRRTESKVESFAFTVPESSQEARASQEASSPRYLDLGISVSVYQRNRFFDACVLPAKVEP